MKPSAAASFSLRTFRQRLIILVTGSLCLWLGFANNFFTIPACAVFWPVCLTLLSTASSNWRSSFCWGFLCTFPGALASLYWLYMPVANVGGLPLPLAMLCAAFICACLSCQGGLYALCIRFFSSLSVSAFALSALLAWYLLEYVFAIVLGFPWLQLAGALIAWPIMLQQADLLGAWLGAGAWVWCALVLVYSRKLRDIGIALSLCCLLLAYSFWRLSSCEFQESPEGPESVRAIFVEGNVDQNQKWTPEFQEYNLSLYIDLTAQALREWQFAERPLIIWPETALPFFYERAPQYALQVAKAVESFGCPLLFGAPGVKSVPGKLEDEIFNRAFLLNPQGELIGAYDKMHLVPFGEYLPEWLNWEFLEALLQGVGVYSEGKSAAPLCYGPLAMGMLICYEGIFPWLAQERVAAGANILVDISNDGWFGDSPAALQHLRLTIPRCLEQNRWLLRATNTGISAVADSRGRLVFSGPMYKAGVLDVSARLEREESFYARIAVVLPFFCLGILCMTGWMAILRRR